MSTALILLSSLVLAMVGGEFDKMVEVDMYGSRPRAGSESLVVPSSRADYYRYEELGEVESSTDIPAREVRPQGRTAGFKEAGGQSGSCYTCNTLTDRTGLCRDIARYQRGTNQTNMPVLESPCEDEEYYCKVFRIDYRVDNMIEYDQWSLERSCSKKCDPFCVTMGGRTKVTYCTSCCRWDGRVKDKDGNWKAGERSDNCNIGNSGSTLTTTILLWLALLTRI